MATDTPKPAKFLLLETLLAHKNLPLQGLYTIHDAAALFDVTPRAIQQRMKRGELDSRCLPGHAKFLSLDLENFLLNSSRHSSPPA
jgi:hypothetical protein